MQLILLCKSFILFYLISLVAILFLNWNQYRHLFSTSNELLLDYNFLFFIIYLLVFLIVSLPSCFDGWIFRSRIHHELEFLLWYRRYYYQNLFLLVHMYWFSCNHYRVPAKRSSILAEASLWMLATGLVFYWIGLWFSARRASYHCI